jgi:predicted dehydrogenase
MEEIANIVVAGAGWWAQGWHLPLLNSLSHVKICAIIEPCDQPRSTLVKDMDSKEQLSMKYNCPVFNDIDELIFSQIKVDGIIVSTPHSTHAQIVLKSLKAGKII